MTANFTVQSLHLRKAEDRKRVRQALNDKLPPTEIADLIKQGIKDQRRERAGIIGRGRKGRTNDAIDELVKLGVIERNTRTNKRAPDKAGALEEVRKFLADQCRRL